MNLRPNLRGTCATGTWPVTTRQRVTRSTASQRCDLQPLATNPTKPATPCDQACNSMRPSLQLHVKVFGYDWLNAWVAPDDYKFCYCGPQGSW